MQGIPQPPSEHQRLLAIIIERATWKIGEFEATLKEPFEKLRLSNSASDTKHGGKGEAGEEMRICLPVVDAFRALVMCPHSPISGVIIQIQALSKLH